MKKLLILGATGMAGHMVNNYLTSLDCYEITNLCFKNKLNSSSIIHDLRSEKTASHEIKSINPNIIINCVGILVKGTKNSLENAIYLNAYFPHFLLKISREIGAKLIHISTDCVFSGLKGRYKDTDLKDALDPYGMTKNLGEIVNDYDLTVRTSIIGPELKQNGEGLFHWFMDQKDQTEVNGYKNVIWSGITTLELSKFIHTAISNNITGLYQVSNNESISKYDLLQMINDVFGREIIINPYETIKHDKSLIATNYEPFKYKVPNYPKMLAELLNHMLKYQNLYKKYFS